MRCSLRLSNKFKEVREMNVLPRVGTTLEMNCNSATLLAVAKATRKRVFLVRSRKEAECKDSEREDLKKERTIPKSQEGALEGRTGRAILKDRRRS